MSSIILPQTQSNIAPSASPICLPVHQPTPIARSPDIGTTILPTIDRAAYVDSAVRKVQWAVDKLDNLLSREEYRYALSPREAARPRSEGPRVECTATARS